MRLSRIGKLCVLRIVRGAQAIPARRGKLLSITPVEEKHWKFIVEQMLA